MDFEFVVLLIVRFLFKAMYVIIDTLDKDRKASGRNVVLFCITKIKCQILSNELITSYLIAGK